MLLISCAERVLLVFLGFFVCLCKHQTETTLRLHYIVLYLTDANNDDRSIHQLDRLKIQPKRFMGTIFRSFFLLNSMSILHSFSDTSLVVIWDA